MKKIIDILLLMTSVIVLSVSYNQNECSYKDRNKCDTIEVKEDLKENVATDNVYKSEINSSNSLNYYLFISYLITFLCVLIIMFMLVFRYIIIGKTASLVPEEWGKVLNDNTNNITSALKSLANNANQNNLNFNKTSENISKILQIFDSYQKALEEKESLIKRYQQGYDSKLIKGFIAKFLYRHKKLSKIIEKGNFDSDVMKEFSRYFYDAIEECGVEEIIIQTGSDYRNLGDKVSDAPKVIITSNKQKDFKVKEVLEKGYLIENNEEATIVMPAKVAIYKFNEEEKQL